MKVYVILENRYDDGNDYPLLHGVNKSYEGAKAVFEIVKKRGASWLASKVAEEDFEIDIDADDSYSAYDSCTGDYSLEVAIWEKELED